MGARVVIQFEGLDEVLNNLTDIEEQAGQNLVKLTADLAEATEAKWQEVTPRRKGRLQEADKANPDGLEITLENDVFYYKFVDEGHNTPIGWRTKHGYRPAKRRSHVEGRNMTEKVTEFIEENIEDYLSKFLDGL